MTKPTWPCPGKPEDLIGVPVGMYHCEYCGEMQIAGSYHGIPFNLDQWDLTEEQRKSFEAQWDDCYAGMENEEPPDDE